MEELPRALDTLHTITPKQRRIAIKKRANVKVEEICNRLRALAFEKGAGSKLPTIRELCVMFNTSTTTLTEAMDRLEHEHILSRKERQGIFVSEALHQRSIHILFNTALFSEVAASPFWSLLWGHLARQAEERMLFQNEHYTFHFQHSLGMQALPPEYVTLLNTSSVHGCLVINFNTHSFEHESLLHIPHVVFAGGGDWMVQIDLQESIRLAAETLIRQGCKRIAYWTSAGLLAHDGLTQFQQTLTQHRLPVYPELFRDGFQSPSVKRRVLTHQEQGYLLVKDCFRAATNASNRPDGIYISDDLLTDGALTAWDELGISIGKDIKVVTHANVNSPILFNRTRYMTVIEQDAADIVHSMFSLLELLMDGVKPSEPLVLVPPRLRTGRAVQSDEA